MKKLICLVALIATINYCSAQTRSEPHSWNATIKVVDDANQPVAGAETWVSYSLPVLDDQSKDWDKIAGVTDSNGMFTVSHNDQSVSIGFHAQKSGYYPTAASYDFGFSADDPKINWNPAQTLVLVKVGEPIPMYAKNEEAKIPKENEPIGFDLTVGDWVAPYGAGKITDLFFTVHRTIVSPSEFDADLELTFPNNGDGIVAVPPTSDASIIMLRSAANDGYQSKLTWNYHNFAESPEPPYGYFFRVRTTIDENGNVKSALYGKIRGDIRFYVGTKAPHAGLGFNYYLNPTLNSQNVEFDPKKNLLNNLGPGEGIKEP